MSKASRNSPEEQLQKAVVSYLDLTLPLDAVCFAVPNEGKRSLRNGARLKSMGLRAGVPDLCFIARGRAFFIELKSKRGVLSDAQKAMIPRLRTAGAETYVCRSLDDVQNVLKAEGVVKAAERRG